MLIGFNKMGEVVSFDKLLFYVMDINFFYEDYFFLLDFVFLDFFDFKCFYFFYKLEGYDE